MPADPLRLHHHRRQRAVGQGCFHTGAVGLAREETPLFATGEAELRYVYDCGSMPRYRAEREAAIDAYLAETGRRRIHLLFISHLHEDHVSGLKRLCDRRTGASVDTIVLPMLNAVDRLICFARTAAESAEVDPFLVDLAVDPVGTLARELSPRRILVVRRGEGGEAPDPAELDPDVPDGPTGTGDESRTGKGLDWSLTGRRRGAGPGIRDEGEARTEVTEIDDTQAIRVGPSGAVSAGWLLAPYVDVEVSQARNDFIAEAAHALAVRPHELEAKAENAKWLYEVLTEKTSDLAGAYAQVENLNVTSLCLFSGPVGHPTIRRVVAAGRWWSERGSGLKAGWLGTGDADLKGVTRRQNFLNHYRHMQTRVTTLLLPHHGSERNFHPELLTALSPDFCVVPAAPYHKWRHPGSAVIQAVASTGRPLWVTTEAQASEVREWSSAAY